MAYNKAAIVLNNARINKAYPPNYLEGMSPAAYANLYNNVKISCRIRNYRCE